MNCFINHFPYMLSSILLLQTAFDLVFAGHFLIREFKKKGGKLGGSEKRVYFSSLISWKKGTFLKLLDKHGLQ